MRQLKQYCAEQIQLADQQLNTRYCGVLSPIKKTVQVLKYLTTTLSPQLNKCKSYNSCLWDYLVSDVIKWLKMVAKKDKPDKYTSLVICENIYYLKAEIESLQSQQLAHCVEEIELDFAAALQNYLYQQFDYKYSQLIKEEAKCKDQEQLRKLYQKWFLLGSYITAGVDKMVERVQKHLSKDTKDSLLPICRERLD